MNFILTSIIASVVLTLAVNLIPALFPRTAEKAERKMMEMIERQHADRTDPDTPKVRVFFPWKAMLLISLALTVLLNLVGFISA